MRPRLRLLLTIHLVVLATLSVSALAADTDGDGFDDSQDNCTLVSNPAQRDTDGDLIGNFCDPDIAQPNNLMVNFVDLSVVSDAFFSNPAVPGWNPDADFDGDNAVNFQDLTIIASYFFGSPGPSGILDQAPTYTNDVQPVLGAKCAPCHTGLGVGGNDIGTNYADAFLAANISVCDGLSVAECSLLRIQNGEMPGGAGCTGDPALDAGNASCLTQQEQDTIQAWIDAGLPE